MTTKKENAVKGTGRKSLESGSCNVLHPMTVRRVANRMPPEEALSELADFYKLFADKTRVGILWALSIAEMCVCDLSMLLQMKQPAISQQLKTLRQMRIIRGRREGKVVFYSLDDDHIRTVLQFGHDHLREALAEQGADL
ncbi:ArsR/SmtB family transcription factor [Desulfatitalea alkaliphila]|uniref:Metalloregulator ArsR/SmtB family transcription factor n=1 Tax=Desulfatitalea alkaliphila TaxID=2929485 RepID=A0AA41RA47_9BACT|nr:metalloregulator ArsR/SmtB family transcription factor [Desulfatitalea alkaliphila]MCJ8501473.1 metalloregulator ArsR/SmtB family transcription factor [Desulfatitalea alkaliphila]